MEKALRYLNEDVLRYGRNRNHLNQTIADYITGKIQFEEAAKVVDQEANVGWCGDNEGQLLAALIKESGYTDEMKRFLKILRRVLLINSRNCLPIMISNTELDILKFYDDGGLGEEALIEDMSRCLMNRRYGRILRNQPGALPEADEGQGKGGGYVTLLAERYRTRPDVFEKLADGGDYFFMTYLYCDNPPKYKEYGDRIIEFSSKKHVWDDGAAYNDEYKATSFFYAFLIFFDKRNELVNAAVAHMMNDNYVRTLYCLKSVGNVRRDAFVDIGEALAIEGVIPMGEFLNYIIVHLEYSPTVRALVVKHEKAAFEEVAHFERMNAKGLGFTKEWLKYLYAFWEVGTHIDKANVVANELVDVFCDYFHDADGLRDFLTVKSHVAPKTKRKKLDRDATIHRYVNHVAALHGAGAFSKRLYEFMVVNDVWLTDEVDDAMNDLGADLRTWYLTLMLTREQLVGRLAQKLALALESVNAEYYGPLYKEWIAGAVGNDLSLYVKAFKKASASVKVYFIQTVYDADPDYDKQFLIDALGDGSKSVQNVAIEYFSSNIKARTYIEPLLQAKKKATRDNAAKLMAIYDAMRDNGDAGIAPAKFGEDVVVEKPTEAFNPLAYCTTNVPSSAGKNIAWTNFDGLPKVRMANSNDVADDVIIVGYLYLILSQTEMVLPPAAAKIRKCLNKDDLCQLGQTLYANWKNDGGNAKRRGVLIIAAMDGDDAFIRTLKADIEDWAKSSRGKLAADAVRAMALQGGDFALMTVDSMAKKFFHKQVRTAAEESFAFAAEQLGIDPEVLADKIVPSLGFDDKGEQTIDYGTRQFTAVINPDLQITIKKDDGKTIKSLPAPGANDDGERAAKAKAEFSAMKKTLKSVVGIQCQRLELALAENRTWSKDEWSKLFVENPIMNMFAIGLVWGLYGEDGSLSLSFRYMEDGSFTDVDENAADISEADGGPVRIGLCHPLDLGEEATARWREQLSDYEVKQPIEQLSRKVFPLADDKKGDTEVADFHGATTYLSSLLGKLQKFGWRRGSVQDAGSYDTFYKEEKKSGVGVQLKFDGSYMGADASEPATVYNAKFYKAGTVVYGSYCYDEIKDEDAVKLADVPPRLYSEICYDIERATLKRISE